MSEKKTSPKDKFEAKLKKEFEEAKKELKNEAKELEDINAKIFEKNIRNFCIKALLAIAVVVMFILVNGFGFSALFLACAAAFFIYLSITEAGKSYHSMREMAQRYQDEEYLKSMSLSSVRTETERLHNIINRVFVDDSGKISFANKTTGMFVEPTFSFSPVNLQTTEDGCSFEIVIKNTGKKAINIASAFSKLKITINCDVKINDLSSKFFDFNSTEEPNSFVGTIKSNTVQAGSSVNALIVASSSRRVDDFTVTYMFT